MELVDDDKEYRLSAELPGMTDEDVEIGEFARFDFCDVAIVLV